MLDRFTARCAGAGPTAGRCCPACGHRAAESSTAPPIVARRPEPEFPEGAESANVHACHWTSCDSVARLRVQRRSLDRASCNVGGGGFLRMPCRRPRIETGSTSEIPAALVFPLLLPAALSAISFQLSTAGPRTRRWVAALQVSRSSAWRRPVTYRRPRRNWIGCGAVVAAAAIAFDGSSSATSAAAGALDTSTPAASR